MTAIGYFISPDITPLARIDFASLKAKGISEVYIRARNTGSNIYIQISNHIILR